MTTTSPVRTTSETAVPPGPAAREPRVLLPTPVRSRRRAGHVVGTAGPPALVALAVIGLWYLLAYFGLDEAQRFILPPPHQVVAVGFLDPLNIGEIFEGLLSTGTVALFAFVLSTVLGLVFAIAMSEARWVERSFYPFAVALQTIPFLALVPLIGFWFGFNDQTRVIVATLASIFPITTNALFGLQSADPALQDLVRLHNRSRLVRLVRLRLPGALPAIFTGLRISAGLSVIAAIVTDFFIRQGAPGIGGLLQNYSANLQSERLYAALLVTCAFGLVVFWTVGLVRKITIGRWESSTATRSDA